MSAHVPRSLLLTLVVILSGAARAADEAVPPNVHLWSTPSHWLEWTVEGVPAGNYELTLHYATRFNTRREIKLNGVAPKGLESVEFKDTAGWTKFQDLKLPAPLTLTVGKNILRITCLDEYSLSLAEILLAAPGGKPVRIQAVDFSGEGGGSVQKLVSDEGGYFNQWDEKGHWLEWTLDKAESGEYEVFLRYASDSYQSRTVTRELQLNGKPAEGLQSFALPVTGGWRFWTEGKLPAKLKLSEAKNVLRLTNLLGESMNLNSIRLRAPGKKEVVLYAVDFTGEGGGKVKKFKKAKGE